MYFIHIKINSILPKVDQVHHIAKIANASTIEICETKLGETILARESLVDGYDLIKLD